MKRGIKLRIVGWIMIVLFIQNIAVSGAGTDLDEKGENNKHVGTGNEKRKIISGTGGDNIEPAEGSSRPSTTTMHTTKTQAPQPTETPKPVPHITKIPKPSPAPKITITPKPASVPKGNKTTKFLPAPKPSKTTTLTSTSKSTKTQTPATTPKPPTTKTKIPSPASKTTNASTPSPTANSTKTPKPHQPPQTTKTPKPHQPPQTDKTSKPHQPPQTDKTSKPHQPPQTDNTSKPLSESTETHTPTQSTHPTTESTPKNDLKTTYYTTSPLMGTENSTTENATSATAVIITKTSDISKYDTSTSSHDIHTVTIESTDKPFTDQGHIGTASKAAPVVMTTIHSTASSPDKLIKIRITEIFVDKDGNEQIELKVLGNKEKLSKYSVHFFSGKEESHFYNLQLSGLEVNEDGYLLVTDNKIKLTQYLKTDGSVSLAVYYNKPDKVNMDKEGLVDAVVITTDQHHVPANLHTLTHQYGNIITTKPSDIKNGFTAMKCSDSEAWKKGRQSTLGKPNPTCRSVTTNNSSNKIKVTVAVVSTCLVIFFFIVILVIVYMRRKQEGIRHFQLSPLSEDDDELILNMEHPSDDYSPGSEPTFGNDYYSKMRKL